MQQLEWRRGGLRQVAESIQVRCECSSITPGTNACRDVESVEAGDLVRWFESAFQPPTPSFDWGAFCFGKRENHEPTAVCCDRLEDGETRYFRGAPK